MACRDRLGRQWSHLTAAGIKEIMKKWEVEIKSQFTPGGRHKEYPIGIPAEAFRASTFSLTDLSKEPVIKNGRIHFQEQVLRLRASVHLSRAIQLTSEYHRSHIKEIFAASFNAIDKLIDDQIGTVRMQGSEVTVSELT